MWKLYDTLIDGIPADCLVDEFICGTYGVLVRSGSGCGFSHILPGDTLPETTKKSLKMPLRELAAGIKSWNFIEASAGMAAINTWYNSPLAATANGITLTNSLYSEDRLSDPFIAYQNAIKNKKVAVCGHFPYIEQLLRPVCELTLIDREPEEGDYPEAAAEYILPESDFVILSCTSLIYKTLPRLLALAQNAYVILVGPFTPLAPVLFSYGVSDLSGFVVKDNAAAANIVAGFERRPIYKTGQKVTLKPGGDGNTLVL
ncbi:Rossmann-like domain-containing protein [Sporomusa aerivorans]|uniref:Rossmann-like domain-containing protein n=1 Tax=Sporomusa aerivorans TaxID=204936 RepID=UPI00352AFF6B